MNVLFVWPGVYLGYGCIDKGFEQSTINHGLASLSAVLKRAGHSCSLLDMRMYGNKEEVDNVLPRLLNSVDAVMIGFLSVDAKYAEDVIDSIKRVRPEVPVIVGGVHVTYCKVESFGKADCVVWGEGESIILDIVDRIKNKKGLDKVVIASIVEDLDTLPWIDRNLFNQRFESQHPLLGMLPVPMFTINLSRGCTNKCTFCLESKNILWKGYRLRDPIDCVNELRSLGNIGSLMIHDDLFPIINDSWMSKFCSEWSSYIPRIPFFCQLRADHICKFKKWVPILADMGMTWVSLGIEGSSRMREFYNKHVSDKDLIEASRILHENNVNIFANYILGAPTETLNDIKELENLLKEMRPELHAQSTYTAYPGSLLYDMCIENNWFVGTGRDPGDHYGMLRYPYERKVVGVDYAEVEMVKAQLRKHKSEYRIYVPKKIEEPTVLEYNDLSHDTCPKVSIILTVYNRPDLTKKAIKSVLGQSLKDIELILINNCSTDPGISDVIQWAKKDTRVRTFTTNYNANNISVEWNLGVEVSRGKYLCLLDNDNMKGPDFCRVLSEYLDTHSEHDAVACYAEMIDQNDRKTGVFTAPSEMTKQNIRLRNYVDSGCLMWRKSVHEKLGWFDERLKTTEDWDWIIRLMDESKGIGVVSKFLTYYRWHGENRTFEARGIGLDSHRYFILKVKPYGEKQDLVVFHQEMSKITASQRDVVNGVIDALKSFDWINVREFTPETIKSLGSCQYAMVIAPFCIEIDHLRALRDKSKFVMFFHIEDPQAATVNLARAKYADFISSNDLATIHMYEGVIGTGNVAYCPSLSVNDILLKPDQFKEPRTDRIMFLGYPYASRIEFIRRLGSVWKQRMGDRKITLVGDDWDKIAKELPIVEKCLPTQDLQSTMQLMRQSRMVILYNRQPIDCGGSSTSMRAQSIDRGYFECASGALVFINDDRSHHDLQNMAVFYHDAEDLVAKIMAVSTTEIYKASTILGPEAFKKYSYRKRILELFNAFRSRRYFYTVK